MSSRSVLNRMLPPPPRAGERPRGPGRGWWCASDVGRHPDRTQHRLGQIGDGAFPPTADLVSAVPESAEPAHRDRSPGHDPAFFPSQVQDRRALDDESVLREPDLQRGVGQIPSRAMLDQGLQRLIELAAQADEMRTDAQGIQ